ncbi:hypothetical protein EYF80_065471 [Liparis tanakae]|uniref:Uncharacterized protein n=1 Tax=Liparis tanakae TaxID=230148 RepID=A0A4Z2E769_9TELE|nr:hypothetical protein EYF80_065471 [Liparis tanakae]
MEEQGAGLCSILRRRCAYASENYGEDMILQKLSVGPRKDRSTVTPRETSLLRTMDPTYGVASPCSLPSNRQPSISALRHTVPLTYQV